MSRVSFGSRAGGLTDNGVFNRQPSACGPYDSLEALAEGLQAEIDTAAAERAPENSTILELTLTLDALIPLVRPTVGPYADGGEHDLPDEFKNGYHDTDPDPDAKHPKATVVSIVNSVANAGHGRGRQIVQRAASRGIIAIIEATDGFRYSFNNAWAAKEEEGSRFSYICQDSMQNKDRHANGYTRTVKHLKDPRSGERGPRKPTYDCKGSVSVKFSTTKQRCDIYYRHYAIHATVAARKPPPRPPPGHRKTTSGWVQLSQQVSNNLQVVQDTGGLSATLQAEGFAEKALESTGQLPPSFQGGMNNTLKRKRTPPPPAPRPRNYETNKPMSLADLLKQSESANPQQQTPLGGGQKGSAPGPVAYDLPSWQTPPPALNRPPNDKPYPLPYQPRKNLSPATPTPLGLSSTPTVKNPSVSKNYQQFRVGKPSSAPRDLRPQAQGLFTTLKPVPAQTILPRTDDLPWPVESFQTPTNPPGPTYYAAYNQPRARQSCTNCRYGKKKCDEGKPCAACVKSGKTDCAYDVPRSNAQNGPSQQPTPQPGPQERWQDQSHSQAPGQAQMISQSNSSQTLQNPPSQNSQATSSQTWQDTQQTPDLASWGSASIAAPPTNDRDTSPDPWFPKR